ncbi:MAG: hypothetical protein ACJ71F_02600, partial [Nitrososphaeraceae archaeon]
NLVQISLPAFTKTFLAGFLSISSEPFQRTDISTQPLGPTLLDALNCGFHKIEGKKARYQQSEV